MVTNGVDLKRFYPRGKDSNLSKQLGLKNKFVVGYIGTLGLAHGLETVLEAARIIEQDQVNKDILFLLAGEGDKKLPAQLALDKGIKTSRLWI